MSRIRLMEHTGCFLIVFQWQLKSVSIAERIYARLVSWIQRSESLDAGQPSGQNSELADSLTKRETIRSTIELSDSPGESAESPDPAQLPHPIQERSIDERASNDLEQGESPDPTIDLSGSALLADIVPHYDSKRYTVEREIDRGGMGVILRVWDENLKRTLAMKVVRGQEQRGVDNAARSASVDTMSRFVREAEITGQLDHPGVVPVHEIGNDEQGRVFFTMRLVQGESLAEINRRVRSKHDSWTTSRALELIVKVCDTVAYAHSKGIIHRDLKPANIMVGRFGETYVMDWGLAKVLGEHENVADTSDDVLSLSITAPGDSTHARLSSGAATMDGSVIGTPAYMPPEQAIGKISELDVRSDIFSVGAMLYELLTGIKPYGDADSGRSGREILAAVIAGPPTPVAQLKPRDPSELIAICEKAMARSREDRYSDMREMAEDLRAYLDNRVVRAYRTGAFAEFKKWVKRNRGVAVASAVAMLFLLGGLGAVIVIQDRSHRRIETEKDAKELAFLKEKEARQLAEQQRRFVEGLFLARESQAALSQNRPTSAMLLAIESLHRLPNYEANNALLAALDLHSEQRMLTGHDGGVRSADYSPAGKRIVTASGPTAAIWDAESGQRIGLLLGHQLLVAAASFSHDGQLVVTASYDHTAVIWEVETGRRLHVLVGDEPLVAARFSPDSRRVATAGYDNLARIWDARSGALLQTLQHTDPVLFLSFSSDGKKLLTGSGDNRARVWKTETGKLMSVLEGHTQSLSMAQFSSDGQQVITAAAPRSTTEIPSDPAARLWDADTGQLLSRLETSSAAASAAFSPDGRWIAVGFADGIARLWNVRQASFTRKVVGDSGWIRRVGFSHDSRTFFTATSRNAVQTWDTQTGNRRATMLGHTDTINTAQFSPDGTRLVTASKDETVRIWRTDQQLVMPQFKHSGVVVSARLAPGNERVVTFAGKQRVPHLWSIPQRRLIATLPHAQPVALASEFNRQGDGVLTSSDGGDSYLWSAMDGTLRLTFENTGVASSVIFGDDDQTVLIVSDQSKAASVWNTKTGELQRRIDLKDTVAYIPGPNGRYLLAISADQFQLRMWDVGTGQVTWESGPTAPQVNAQFSPDGNIVRTFDIGHRFVQLWRAATGEKLATLTGHSGSIYYATFGADGESVFTISLADRTARRWSVSTGREQTRLEEPGGVIDSILTANGQRLVTRATNNRTRLWNLTTGKPICPLGSDASRIQEFRFSPDGRYLLTGQRSPVSTTTPADSHHIPASIWNADTGQLLFQVNDDDLLSGVDFTGDSDWVVTVSRDQQRTVRFTPVDSVNWAKRFTTRDLTVNERELHHVGTKDQRDAFRRRAELSEVMSRLTLMRSLRNEHDNTAQSNAYVADALEKLVALIGPEPSKVELQAAIELGEGLLSGDHDSDPMVLGRLAELDVQRGDLPTAILRLERAVQHPACMGNIEERLQDCRGSALPDLISFASIDALVDRSDGARQNDITEFHELVSSEDARLRSQYLQARLEHSEGRLEAAMRGYRRVIKQYENEFPEPYLHLAECLRQGSEPESAERVLRDALQHRSCRTPEVWNRWLALSLAELNIPPVDVLDTFPASSSQREFGRSLAEHLCWLLLQLASGNAVRVNCGGDQYVDASGNTWASDRFFTHGFRSSDIHVPFTQDIELTENDPLYQTRRYFDARRQWTPAGYHIPLPRGRYRVTLHFADSNQNRAGEFDVLIENQPLLTDYDPSRVGFATADVKSTDVDVQDGLLEIEFFGASEAAEISAMEVQWLDGDNLPEQNE